MGKGSLVIDDEEKPSIGSITSRILRTSKIPVITIGGKKLRLGFKNILLPLDLTKETRQKVSWAIQFAKLFNAEIQVVSSIWENKDFVVTQINSQMKQVVSFISKQGVKVKGEIIRPKDGDTNLRSILNKYIKEHDEIDLAIIMTQQEDDFTHLFVGSSATSFISESKIPVMSIVPRKLDDIVVGF
jgi:nucleotide-binding universal stress UspA family protein